MLLGAAVTLYLLSRGRKIYSWQENYYQKNEGPYGTWVLHELLESLGPAYPVTDMTTSLEQALADPVPAAANYVFVGEALYLDSLDQERLLAFVNAGNTAIISARTFPFSLIDPLYHEVCDYYNWDEPDYLIDSSLQINFYHPELRLPRDWQITYRYRNSRPLYQWQYFSDQYFCNPEEGFQAIGYCQDSLVNFARIPYGEGYFYLHSTPLALANIQLLDTTGLAYAQRIFSHLTPGPIFWDEYTKVPMATGQQRNDRTSRSLSERHVLQYILSQPALALAWYSLLLMALLYVIFRTKRRQRRIPILEPNTNMSLEFVQTIGRLSFLQGNHYQLALQQMKLFLGFVRQRYRLPTRELDEHFAAQLSTVSEVPLPTIENILLMYQNIARSKGITENTLLEFHQRLEKFYLQCK